MAKGFSTGRRIDAWEMARHRAKILAFTLAGASLILAYAPKLFDLSTLSPLLF